MTSNSQSVSQTSERLSRVSTEWSLVFEANRPAASEASLAEAVAARQKLLLRYCGAIERYLLSALGDADAVSEVSQRFALCFARGDFKNANPEKGRFRDFVRTVLFHQLVDYRREIQKQKERHGQLAGISEVAVASGSLGPAQQAQDDFLRSWREELLDRAWSALAEQQRQHGGLRFTVLRLRADRPDASSAELTAELSAKEGREFTATQVRQIVHRARESFAELLLDETICSLDAGAAAGPPNRDEIEQELIDLGFIGYCREALAARREAR